MAIARTGYYYSGGEVSLNGSTNFTVPTIGVEKMLVLRISSVNYGGYRTTGNFAPTYNGVPMQALCGANYFKSPGFMFVGLWYLIAPPEGVSYTLAYNGPAENGAVAVDVFSGVDQKSPFGSFFTTGGKAINGAFSQSLASQANNYDLDAIATYSVDPYASNTGSQTTDSIWGTGGFGRSGHFCHQAGATTSTFSYTESNGAQGCAYLIAGIRPSTAVRGRGVYYNIDVWDPQRRILDPNGRIVKPWEVEPNHWGRIAGLFLPTPDKPATYVEDPELFFIEGTDYSDDTASLKIETSRGQLGEVMLRRAVAGNSG